METLSTILNVLEYDSEDSQSNSCDLIRVNENGPKNSRGRKEIKIKLNSAKENLTSESSDDYDEIILSVYWKRGKLGAAYYSCKTAELHLLNDMVDAHPEFNNLRTLVNQTQPSQIVTRASLPDDFVKTLSDLMLGKCEEHNSEKGSSKNIFFMSTKNKKFSYESCKRYILGLRLGFEPENLSEKDHILFMNSYVDLALESMVISLGMLIKYLEKHLPQINLNYDLPQITFLNHISLTNSVSMDDNTYKALQIFNAKVHPSAYKRNTSGLKREGLSLFGIFSRCRSNAGIKRMKEIFTHPSKNIEELNERLDAIEFCCKPQHQHIIQNIVDCIKRVESVTGTLANIYKARSNISHWRSLYSSLYNAILIGEICQKYISHSKLLEKVAKSITQNVHEVTHYINQVINFEESSAKNHFTVRNGVDSKLDLLRQTYAQIPEVLIKVAEIELQDLPSFIEQCSVIYITELGYLLSVPVWTGDGTQASDYVLPNFEIKIRAVELCTVKHGFDHSIIILQNVVLNCILIKLADQFYLMSYVLLPDLESKVQFIVNNYIHYKTPRCAELDNVLGDFVASVSNIESKIMITLIQFIHTRITDIANAFRLIAELDCVISLATIASENNYRRPTLTEEKKLEIIQGRHPLQELCVGNFVPNDTIFGNDGGILKILTGPNASGKSVYLKQVALIAYLAHIGSFVPAQSAIIPILDHIHSRIQSVECISTRLSAFLIDLKQMSLALYNSTPRSLIIIDEFGKGTTEIDGLSLMAASLIHFIERKENCPFTLVSTHFHSLPRLLPSTPLVHLQYMDYLVENEEIVYLHKAKDGTSGSSLTFLAAKTAGLTKEAINRSLEILEGVSPLECNPKLEITKTMAKEILYMEKIFDLSSQKENPSV